MVARAVHTSRTIVSVISAYIGSERSSDVVDSATGKSPFFHFPAYFSFIQVYILKYLCVFPCRCHTGVAFLVDRDPHVPNLAHPDVS